MSSRASDFNGAKWKGRGSARGPFLGINQLGPDAVQPRKGSRGAHAGRQRPEGGSARRELWSARPLPFVFSVAAFQSLLLLISIFQASVMREPINFCMDITDYFKIFL